MYIIIPHIKIIFHPLGCLAGFPPEISFFDRKTSEALGTHYLQVTVTMVFKCLRQRSNGLRICLPAVFYMYMYVFAWFHSV